MDISILESKIRANFPSMTWSRAQIVAHGWTFNVLILDDRWAFRFPKADYAFEILKREVDLMKWLQDKIATKIPLYTKVAKDCSFAGYRAIQGSTFKPWRYYSRLSPTARKKIAKELVG